MNLFNKLRRMKTLLIDDDEWIRDSMSIFFEGEECFLLALETAEEGIKKLKKEDYDIIIADYRLPGMDGLEFLKQAQESQPNVIRVLITAYGSKDVISRAVKMGVQGLIEKPFTSEIIEKYLSRLIEKHERKMMNSTNSS